jgi:hypothetical protein
MNITKLELADFAEVSLCKVAGFLVGVFSKWPARIPFSDKFKVFSYSASPPTSIQYYPWPLLRIQVYGVTFSSNPGGETWV